MKIFEGKSPTERNKIIAAIVLGAMALFVLSYVFVIPLFRGKTTITVSTSPTPKTTVSPGGTTTVSSMPTTAEEEFTYTSTPVYFVSSPSAPEPGRNIFAFYEPPVPTPFSPTPYSPTPVKELPTPTPPPPFALFSAAVPNGAVYAGQAGFLIELSGDKFTQDSQINFNGQPLPTVYYSPQRLTAEVPAGYVANATTIFITVTTPGGLYSNPISLVIQPQPKPAFTYIGAVLRRGNNNNTAYIKEGTELKTVRLNDPIGRFQVVSISKNEIVVKDIALGFVHRVRLAEGSGQSTSTTRTENQNNQNFNANPNQPVYQEIPGIPNNIPRYNPNSNVSPIQQQQQQKQQQQQNQKDDDDDGDN